MSDVGIFVGGVATGLAVAAAIASMRRAAATSASSSAQPPDPATGAAAPPPAPTVDVHASVHAIAREIDDVWQATSQPDEILEHPRFQEAVALLREHGDLAALLDHATGTQFLVACMALDAMTPAAPVPSDPPEVADRIVDALNEMAPWAQFFAFRTLARRTPPSTPLIGRVLQTIEGEVWAAFSDRFLRDFVVHRLAAGEEPDLTRTMPRAPLGRETLERILRGIPEPGRTRILAELQAWGDAFIDLEHLRTVGRVWSASDTEDVLDHPALQAAVDAMRRSIGEGRPMLLLGESGVGKTSAVRALARDLMAQGWTIFQAGHHELIAGTRFHGMFEERVNELLQRLARKRVLWIVPRFHDLAWTGRTMESRVGLLDHLLPAIERGEITVLGETEPPAFERLAVEKPRCRSAMDTIRIRPMGMADTLALARRWAEAHAIDRGDGTVIAAADDDTLDEAWQLTQQFLQDRSPPGNFLDLLDGTRTSLTRAGEHRPLRTADLIHTLSRLTGLPDRILDDREKLDLDGMRRQFTGKVMGQPDAVECLVQRVAMIKAGVTDPTRPLGVFLFAGPTGTGKTELCKTLAEFLFGSPQRMLRIDMSELQTPDSLDRLVGSAHPGSQKALVDQIRERPFSLVLLDEFEKAHAQVWDLFLQLFDDGRLTDRRGNTADFRHAIVVLTSNLGAVVRTGATLGFGSGTRFDPSEVERALATTFRREFLNRIDQVVVFRPLTRQIMRGILEKELRSASQRRGLRNRPWAVEWDESALEYLLDQGFTPDLGARPLKRAIDAHVLAPLATAIVTHQLPAGDQFLFVRSDGKKIDVEFVDPDAADPTPNDQTRPAAATEPGRERSLETIALDPQGNDEDVRFLRKQLGELRGIVEGQAWTARKEAALAATGDPGFWESPRRFEVLGELEYRDRVGRNLRSVAKLLTRSLPRAMTREVALKLRMIREACLAVENGDIGDAVVIIEAGHEPVGAHPDARPIVATLRDMYLAWAQARGLRAEVLTESTNAAHDGVRCCLAITGFGALPILRHEHGMHVFEERDVAGAGASAARPKARVLVGEQPADLRGDSRSADAALAAIAPRRSAAESTRIVRRYRAEPSPLVRDSVRGWRTGRADRVLTGDFDLIGSPPAGAADDGVRVENR